MVAMVWAWRIPIYDVSVEVLRKYNRSWKMRTMVELDKIYLKQNPETELTELDTQMVKLKMILAENRKIHIKERVESLLYNESLG
jgi:hypothetical protein